jgi:rubrerythrin
MNKQNEKFVHAYEKMLERSKTFLAETGHAIAPKVDLAVESAKEKAAELGELTLGEAEKIAEYLKRDLQDAAEFLTDENNELRDWLRLDVELVEDRILDALSLLVDRTKVDLAEFAEQAQRFGEWHTGEITGPGTLVCKECGEVLHFHKTGHIPPCPKCHATAYRRATG